ncbi:lysophospholipid acyltransferase family protein [soil metagenome]
MAVDPPPRRRTRKKLTESPAVASLLSWLAATLIRALGSTLRFTVEDRGGVVAAPPEGPLLWVFWHNRILIGPYVYQKFLPGRRGAVLTSPSGDGEMIARVLKRFGVDSVRGSSSKRGGAAMVAMLEWVRRGLDVVVTPDGPRGPKYYLRPGIIKLAEATGAPIFPVHLKYSNAWALKTWDSFLIPKPFSNVHVVFDALWPVPAGAGKEAVESERARLEAHLKSEVA